MGWAGAPAGPPKGSRSSQALPSFQALVGGQGLGASPSHPLAWASPLPLHPPCFRDHGGRRRAGPGRDETPPQESQREGCALPRSPCTPHGPPPNRAPGCPRNTNRRHGCRDWGPSSAPSSPTSFTLDRRTPPAGRRPSREVPRPHPAPPGLHTTVRPHGRTDGRTHALGNVKPPPVPLAE